MSSVNAGYSFHEALAAATRASLGEDAVGGGAGRAASARSGASILNPAEYNDICSITRDTLESLAKAGTLVRAPCGHKFSMPELVNWLQMKGACPSCRAPTDESSLKVMKLAKERIAPRGASSSSSSSAGGGGSSSSSSSSSSSRNRRYDPKAIEQDEFRQLEAIALVEECKLSIKQKLAELLACTDDLILESGIDAKAKPCVVVKFWCTEAQEKTLQDDFKITVRVCEKSCRSYVSLGSNHLQELFGRESGQKIYATLTKTRGAL